MNPAAINDREFEKFRGLIYQKAGISLSPVKKTLVAGRLGSRLRHYGLSSYGAYYQMVTEPGADHELQVMVDLLTTNETYFFREPKHFDILSNQILPKYKQAGSFRVWSAASSSGEEAYSIGMTLAHELGFNRQWEILGTDISSRVLERARRGLYSHAASGKIPKDYLRKYCLKGVRSQEGMILIDKPIRDRISFKPLNLNGDWPKMEKFDAIFLRNVMIYFDVETKRTLVDRLANMLKPDGYFIIGHSETLNSISNRFDTLFPSIYQLKE